MNAERICELATLVPVNGRVVRMTHEGIHKFKKGGSEKEWLNICLNNPQFGWCFVVGFALLDMELPCCINEEILIAANESLQHATEAPATLVAYQIEYAHSPRIRNHYRSALLIPSVSFETIASTYKSPEAVLNSYHDLFFTVRGRMDDLRYISTPITEGLAEPSRDPADSLRDHYMEMFTELKRFWARREGQIQTGAEGADELDFSA
jgi:hypothetical protein